MALAPTSTSWRGMGARTPAEAQASILGVMRRTLGPRGAGSGRGSLNAESIACIGAFKMYYGMY